MAAEKGKKKTISFTVDAEDYEEIKQYAQAKGHGGQFPASVFSHYAVFQMMKKYPLNEAEMKKSREKYQIGILNARAVQL
jgi:hypothetical protein